ncbi:hypothetical protein YC2023_114410 [Brassica napus]
MAKTASTFVHPIIFLVMFALGDKLLLRVRGALLALIHVSSSDPLPHLSIKNTPIETSSAQFIRQRYTAASSGQKFQNSIISAYGEAQDDH